MIDNVFGNQPITQALHDDIRPHQWLDKGVSKRLNAFSKKLEPHYHMVCLYTVWYNFVRMHKTLKCSPAMAAGLSAKLWEMSDIVALIDAQAEAPKPRGSYKTKARQAADAAENSN